MIKNKEATLRQCEAVIEEGLQALNKVERALYLIDELKLYPESYKNIEEYCSANWALLQGLDNYFPSKQEYANRIIPLKSVK